MADSWTEDRLAVVLASVGEHLVLPRLPELPDGGLAPVPGMTVRRTGGRWRMLAAAVVVVAALVVGTLVGPVREAVADWLGIGSTRIERVPDDHGDPAGLPPLDARLVPATSEAATAELGRPLPEVDTTPLGPPDQVAIAPEGGVILGWDEGQTTLWLYRLDDPAAVRLRKLATRDDRIERLDGLGEAALVVEGEHVLTTPDRRLAADTVVLWIDDGLEYRLESHLDLESMVDIARSVR